MYEMNHTVVLGCLMRFCGRSRLWAVMRGLGGLMKESMRGRVLTMVIPALITAPLVMSLSAPEAVSVAAISGVAVSVVAIITVVMVIT